MNVIHEYLYNSEYLAHTIFKIGKWINRASNWLTIQCRGESWLSITISFIMFCVIHLSLRKELVAHFVSFHVWVCVHTQKRPIVINCFWFQKTTAAKEKEEEEILKNHCTKHKLTKISFWRKLYDTNFFKYWKWR